MRRLFALSELPVSVTSTMASARRGGLTSVAPQLNSTWAVDAVLGQPAARQVHDLGGDALALQVLDALDRRVVGHGQHPAHGPAADLAEDQLGHLVDLGVVLQDPVVAGQAAVERAVLDVAGHLLGADQRAVDLRVVDAGVVAAAGEGDLVAGLAEQLAGRLLQAAGGDAEFEDRCRSFLVHLLRDRTAARRRPRSRRASTWRKKQLA